MSKVAIEGNVSGTGTLTIAAPNTNTNRTITLPDATGTIDRLNRAGNVLQVVSTTNSDLFATSSNSFVTTFGLSITPSSASSKVLVLFLSSFSTEVANRQQFVTIFRDAVNLGGTNGMVQNLSTGSLLRSDIHLSFLDSPSTTSSVTYSLAHKSNAGSVEIPPLPNMISSVLLMEIAG